LHQWGRWKNRAKLERIAFQQNKIVPVNQHRYGNPVVSQSNSTGKLMKMAHKLYQMDSNGVFLSIYPGFSITRRVTRPQRVVKWLQSQSGSLGIVCSSLFPPIHMMNMANLRHLRYPKIKTWKNDEKCLPNPVFY
jgi:hypothetical protein